MEQLRLTAGEAIVYVALFGMAVGFLVGLVPLIFGWRKGKTRLGVISLVVSIVLGAIGPILSLVSMVVFVYLIARKPSPSTAPAQSEAPSQRDDR